LAAANHNQFSVCKEYQLSTTAGEDEAKQEALYIAGGNANYYNHYGKQYGDSSKN
jgi:hypothetical protein